MRNPYRPPESRVDQALPEDPRGKRCAWGFVSGVVWSILIIAIFFVLTTTDSLHEALFRVRFDRIAVIASGCGVACAILALVFRRFPLWLYWVIGLVPMMLLAVVSMFV